MTRLPRSTWALVACLLTLTGCLPSSCQREEPRALFPADSLSRELASALPVDTLARAWQFSGTDTLALGYPRTLQFGPDGLLYVADAERNAILRFDTTGTLVDTWQDGFEVPYLGGWRGDTLLVFNPEAYRIDLVVDGAVARSIATTEDVPYRNRLLYVAAHDSLIYLKMLGTDFENHIAVLDASGTEVERIPLEGPFWRRAGLLRTWGDTLLSLSGYRPVVDVVSGGGVVDTLALRGFDSPMLARSRGYMTGEIREAPLLTASAAPAGDLLFVLNMRPGWLRVDAFGRDGEVEALLVEPDPGFGKQFYPVDVAARKRADGSYELAVALVKPEPRVDTYRWTPQRSPTE